MLPRRAFCIRAGRCLRERSVRKAQRTRIPTQMSQSTEHLGVGTAQEQGRQQGIFLPPGEIDLIDDSDHFLRS
jgi:hypothetical protein